MFGVLPVALKALPLSEFQVMVRYYLKERKDLDLAQDQHGSDPTDGVVIE